MLLKWFYGVTVAQEILVLLEIVRVSLELLFWVSTYFMFNLFIVLLLVKVVVQKLLNLHLFWCLFLFSINFYISTACDKSLSYMPLKQLGNALHTQI